MSLNGLVAEKIGAEGAKRCKEGVKEAVCKEGANRVLTQKLDKTCNVYTMNAMNKTIKWDLKKSAWLKASSERGGVGFEECVVLIEAGKILDSIDNPSSNHPDQKAFVLEISGYAYLVPYVETDEEIFLKTVYPSRKFTEIYLGEEKT